MTNTTENVALCGLNRKDFQATKPDNKRGVDEDIIEELAKQKGLNGQCYKSVKEAYKAASHNASHDDFIFVGGSTYIVADFLKECV